VQKRRIQHIFPDRHLHIHLQIDIDDCDNLKSDNSRSAGTIKRGQKENPARWDVHIRDMQLQVWAASKNILNQQESENMSNRRWRRGPKPLPGA
jgi:hypothetical protein